MHFNKIITHHTHTHTHTLTHTYTHRHTHTHAHAHSYTVFSVSLCALSLIPHHHPFPQTLAPSISPSLHASLSPSHPWLFIPLFTLYLPPCLSPILPRPDNVNLAHLLSISLHHSLSRQEWATGTTQQLKYALTVLQWLHNTCWQPMPRWLIGAQAYFSCRHKALIHRVVS